ncbi:hypothetical protein FN846DRAFT_908833 [Sphaerosporella brunnea]|uniref:Uncharacterized protein n=1 Tax=Sphaerosporella brunnea TaxID=1250544 RepID=A0A5J5ESI9_9PEZI|nr:hypothetical protein FN846DRAFT_908833 [Sphaerosporella brunnea]
MHTSALLFAVISILTVASAAPASTVDSPIKPALVRAEVLPEPDVTVSVQVSGTTNTGEAYMTSVAVAVTGADADEATEVETLDFVAKAAIAPQDLHLSKSSEAQAVTLNGGLIKPDASRAEVSPEPDVTVDVQVSGTNTTDTAEACMTSVAVVVTGPTTDEATDPMVLAPVDAAPFIDVGLPLTAIAPQDLVEPKSTEAQVATTFDATLLGALIASRGAGFNAFLELQVEGILEALLRQLLTIIATDVNGATFATTVQQALTAAGALVAVTTVPTATVISTIQAQLPALANQLAADITSAFRRGENSVLIAIENDTSGGSPTAQTIIVTQAPAATAAATADTPPSITILAVDPGNQDIPYGYGVESYNFGGSDAADFLRLGWGGGFGATAAEQ